MLTRDEHLFYLKKKVDFVDKLSEAISEGIAQVAFIEYVVLEYKEHENCFEEFIVVHFVGGAISPRCSNMNSHTVIVSEIAKLLNGGYYNEVDYYKALCNNERLVRVF